MTHRKSANFDSSRCFWPAGGGRSTWFARTVFLWLVPAAVLLSTTPAQAASCGDTLMGDTVLTADLDCAGNALMIGAADVTLDCQGHSIMGDGSGHGIMVDRYMNGVTIRNCGISGFGTGINLYYVQREHLIEDNVISSVDTGIRFGDSVWHSTVTRNTITEVSGSGITMWWS
ncbi:MAG: right-handed parallel beta-helix repeat-containing protein, partial [Elusimicrobiota bacterium]